MLNFLPRIAFSILALCLISLAPRAADAQAVQVVANCGTLNGQAPPLGSANGPVTVNQLGQLCASASVSASITGFAPNGNFANLTATNSSASVALPAGAVVIFQNTGTTTVSCTVGIGSATALVSEVQIPASSSVPFTVGSNTFGACIDQTGSASNVIALAGGAGLFTGFGGGGGGSGGAVTNAGTFAVQLTGATNNINNIAGTVSLPTGAATSALQTTGNTSLTTINTTLGSPFQAGGALAANQSINFNQYAGNAVTCTMTAYGTAPTGNCPGFNTFVTNATPGLANNADAIASVAAGATSPVPVNNYNYVYNGTTWDRARSVKAGSGMVAVANGGSRYQAVAASATATVLQSSTGATGDYLSHCTIYPATTSPGAVTVFDGSNTAANSAILFPGGASSVSNLVPFSIPVGALSRNGSWQATTGTNVSIVCEGSFS